MANQPDYADRLRETLLALAIVPLAGFDTATYWLRESLSRSSRFGSDVVATTALARFTRPADDALSAAPNPVADVLAQDLMEAARTYVRSMVRLPADAGVYFTGEIERRLNAILEQIQPEAEKDLEGYADAELQRLRLELDRLYVVVRAEAQHVNTAKAKAPPPKVVENIGKLRERVSEARPAPRPGPPTPLSLAAPPEDHTGAFKAARARANARKRLRQALRDVESLVPDEKDALERLGELVEEHLPPEPVPPSANPPKKRD